MKMDTAAMHQQWLDLAGSIANLAQALVDNDAKYEPAQRYAMVRLLVNNIDTLQAWTPNPH
jgi:hypothetical protein